MQLSSCHAHGTRWRSTNNGQASAKCNPGMKHFTEEPLSHSARNSQRCSGLSLATIVASRMRDMPQVVTNDKCSLVFFLATNASYLHPNEPRHSFGSPGSASNSSQPSLTKRRPSRAVFPVGPDPLLEFHHLQHSFNPSPRQSTDNGEPGMGRDGRHSISSAARHCGGNTGDQKRYQAAWTASR